nr:DUF4439 domain-containing protein [Kineosporia babensis]
MSPVTASPPARVNRRIFLTLGTTGAATTLAALSGCSAMGGTAVASTPNPDTVQEEAAVKLVLAQVKALHTGASNLASGTRPDGSAIRIPGATARLLTQITAVHEAQLTALGSPVATTATPSSSPTPSESAAEESAIASPGKLVTAEWNTARLALTHAAGLSPEFALLLYKIAASCAANADLLRTAVGKGRALGELTPVEDQTTDDVGASAPEGTTGTAGAAETTDDTGASTPEASAASPIELTDGEAEALNRLLAGEHAAFYAYPLVIAHVDSARRTVANSLWEAHRQQRDELERMLVEAQQEPVESGAAYKVAVPASAGKAAALAAQIERRLGGLAVDVIAAAEDDQVESTAAGLLVLSTRRQAAWSNKPVADPGV